MRILPPDYTGEGDYWSHSDKYHKQRQREKLAYVQRSKNGLLTLPKFDEARVRYTRGLYDNRTFDDLKDDGDDGLGGIGAGSDGAEPPGDTRPQDETRPPEVTPGRRPVPRVISPVGHRLLVDRHRPLPPHRLRHRPRLREPPPSTPDSARQAA
ncbi:hypothetical protein PINS_up019871 [Pythium insidiosum]|nr:hypothetical protein PINS_up019871 [Pythium insidiosum]